ncbi:hypothetical protein TPHA_0A02970 [Tetrapisispora phaffii CBS 4417]|uniref:Glycogenin glucosyltransferase n=1 Tax=Tetrapisispora phaffii (strain ATCC 24235 / CBS 4417 / NBRC 1672 / NRRL Y-8282 / UCD 70-5) TaxID=1071381 RepID=G8BN99_TETPH|nr:hypothetical protein TPHA_0A02970 [Tetrapisispora phaffii CBS 4417]CCE61377.1 hypothetical protein TPHA_0A02970 [Tetrapisispora phaffii CBS 4417]
MKGETAVCTLLYSLDYLPGVFTLGTRINKVLSSTECTVKFKVVLLVNESLWKNDISEEVKELLNKLFDNIIQIRPLNGQQLIEGLNKSNKNLLNRPELLFAVIKLKLWSLVEFEKIVYLDCDTLPIQNLFFNNILQDTKVQTKYQISASSDIGWPDMFNSGVMVIIPDLEVYDELTNFALNNISLDSSDQGILNQFFNPFFHKLSKSRLSKYSLLRLPFVYNITIPNNGYQYSPALNYFKNEIQCVHFIGVNKPWRITDGSRDENEYSNMWKNMYREFQLDYLLLNYMQKINLNSSINDIDSHCLNQLLKNHKTESQKDNNIQVPAQFNENKAKSDFVEHIIQESPNEPSSSTVISQSVDFKELQFKSGNESVPNTALYRNNVLITYEKKDELDTVNNNISFMATHPIERASDNIIYGKEMPLNQLVAPLPKEQLRKNTFLEDGTKNGTTVFDWEKTNYLEETERVFPDDTNGNLNLQRQDKTKYTTTTLQPSSAPQTQMPPKKKSDNNSTNNKRHNIPPIFEWENTDYLNTVTRTFPEDD